MALWIGNLRRKADEFAFKARGLDTLALKRSFPSENTPVFTLAPIGGLVVRRELRSEEAYLKSFTPFVNKKSPDYLNKLRTKFFEPSEVGETFFDSLMASVRGVMTEEEQRAAQEEYPDMDWLERNSLAATGSGAPPTTTEMSEIVSRAIRLGEGRGSFAAGGHGGAIYPPPLTLAEKGGEGGGGGGGGRTTGTMSPEERDEQLKGAFSPSPRAALLRAEGYEAIADKMEKSRTTLEKYGINPETLPETFSTADAEIYRLRERLGGLPAAQRSEAVLALRDYATALYALDRSEGGKAFENLARAAPIVKPNTTETSDDYKAWDADSSWTKKMLVEYGRASGKFYRGDKQLTASLGRVAIIEILLSKGVKHPGVKAKSWAGGGGGGGR